MGVKKAHIGIEKVSFLGEKKSHFGREDLSILRENFFFDSGRHKTLFGNENVSFWQTKMFDILTTETVEANKITL